MKKRNDKRPTISEETKERRRRAKADLRPAIERFWSKTMKQGACLVWTGPFTGPERSRYGAFSTRKTDLPKITEHRAHRWIYARVLGEIRPSTVVMHSCDNPLCVSIQHLTIGSYSLNNIDTADKGRKVTSKHGPVRLGQKFGRLIVIGAASPAIQKCGKHRRRWLCRCECDGKEVAVPQENLQIGKTQSCGCFMRDNNRALTIVRNKAQKGVTKK